MANGRFFGNSGRAAGRSPPSSGGFDLGAVGRKVGDFFTNTALPYLRDKAAPAFLNTIDPSLGDTYNHAKDAIMQKKSAQDVIGGLADDITGKVVPAALGKAAPHLLPQYTALQKGVAGVKDSLGIGSTADILKGQGAPKNLSVSSAVRAGQAVGQAASDFRNANGKRPMM